ncbi:31 kDa ribonucleoprotein, chloroplastic-like [Aegilops tauschii subsp. strangulata]|uniref:31 kDa ribonucleoprotein, chloroplastic-like n=1 Tax=Aegilops tauschii subsp. strangulata TaxID=200361 RepID=UPI00098BA401
MVEVVYDRMTGRSRGFGFVTMGSAEEVAAAVEQFNGYGSGGDADCRREVRGLDGVVAADVRRGEAAARHLPLAPQHTGCGARVR